METARSLKRELTLAGDARAAVVGCITADRAASGDPETPVLGAVAELCSLISVHRIDLLVVSGEAPRVAVFDQAISFVARSIRICELSDFCEALFGRVPTAEINACWFAYLVSPSFRESRPGKRALDIVLALSLLLLSLPLVAGLALVIISDGGPLFFRQVRIGERGRPITIYKLRTMRPGSSTAPRWSSLNDPRVTSIGRFLRRSHLDELPQLVNVLRGQMSMVGPRPEQPEFVTRLERTLPFYERRHLIKPGITGWAQIRCGYAGSNQGSAWKLCHDLYYMKYRSIRLDLWILLRTVRLVFRPPQLELEPNHLAAFIAAANLPVPDQRSEPQTLLAAHDSTPHRNAA